MGVGGGGGVVVVGWGLYLLEAACLDAGTINILPKSRAKLLQFILHHRQLPLHYQDVLNREQTGRYTRAFMFHTCISAQ